MSVRDKDAGLGRTCSRYRTAAYDALGWIADNGRLVGPARPALERALKRHAMEARRLATAAVRPMSVAVFGPSQAGKSFLVGKLITPQGRAARVVFGVGDERVTKDFLSEVNPQGGRETTGLVTRFSIVPEDTPAGFPVSLRLMREGDVVKVLVNSFVFDLTTEYPDRSILSEEKVSALVAQLESQAGTGVQPGLTLEDVFDLREYLEDSLPKHPFVAEPSLREAYWPAMERLLPLLPPDGRGAALAPLWGSLAPFNELYRDLKVALDLMEHGPVVYAPLSAIEDTTNGVLHVNRIYELDNPGAPGGQPIEIALTSGRRVTLKQAVATALTAELRVTLDEAPWPFMEHTDLLDFPGARSRHDSTPAKVFSGDSAEQLSLAKALCYLRGKVAVLFDNYVTDLDVNSMLLCLPDSNLEVRKLPHLVAGWVERTHGPTPRDRLSRLTSLFFCMTKTDRLFGLSSGGTAAQAVENRLEVNFKEFSDWMELWHPGKPFDNSYLLRNPQALEVSDVFAYAGEAESGVVRAEAGLNPDFEGAILPAFTKAFMGNALTRKHIADPQAKWEAMLSLNDGGITRLATDLGPVCDPDLKYRQIAPRSERLAADLRALLSSYFEDSDIQARVAERVGKAKAAFTRMTGSVNPPLGLFLQELTVDEATLRRAYLDYVRQGRQADDGDNGDGGVPPAPAPVADHGFGIDLDTLSLDLGVGLGAHSDAPSHPAGQGATKGARKGTARRAGFGEAVVARWFEGLHAKPRQAALLAALGLDGEHFLTFVNELEVGCRRFGLAEQVSERAEAIIAYHQDPTTTATSVALESSLVINEFVHDLGRTAMAGDADPEWSARARALIDRPTPPGAGVLPALPTADPELAAFRRRNPQIWAMAFLQMTQENAASSEGQMVDPEQNARLGAVLKQLEA